MKIISAFGAIAVTAMLCACADDTITAQARSDMESSKEAYKHCLSKNQATPDACDAKKRAYEADMESYKTDIEAFKANTAADSADK